MMHLCGVRQCRPSFRRLLAICLCGVVLAAGAAPPPGEPRDTRERFVELDGEIQEIKEEILAINRDILLLEELVLYAHGQQLIVLVSVAKDSPVHPDRISLQLDGQRVTHHVYTGNENAALQEGGVHRLYTGRLGAGEHRLEVSVTGTRGRGREFQQQQGITLTKGPDRQYLEVHLGADEDSAQPRLTLRGL